MTKVYKMPVLRAFYNGGQVRMGVTEQELEDYYERNSDSDFYTKENLCCLILHNEYFVGEDSSEFEPHDTYYMGYMDDGYYDAANMQSGNYAAFVQLD